VYSWDSWYLIRARIKCCTKSFTYFLDSGFKLLALEEDDEHGLVNLVAAKERVFKGVFNFSLSEKHISAAGTPQHPFECRQSFSKDDTGNEAELKTATLQATTLFWKKLLMLAKLTTTNVHLILFFKELLGFSKDMLQLCQLQEVLLQSLGILIDLYFQSHVFRT
jgi:hypothetical protein